MRGSCDCKVITEMHGLTLPDTDASSLINLEHHGKQMGIQQLMLSGYEC